jgi:lysozyme
MTPSDLLYEFLRGWEGQGGQPVLTAYLDSANVPTIGYGHTRHVTVGDTCTADQAEQWLENDLAPTAVAMTAAIRVPESQQQFDAICSLAFNVGIGAIRGSTLLRKLNAADTDGAALQFTAWEMAGGQVVAGLEKRRIAEQQIFLNADYGGRP